MSALSPIPSFDLNAVAMIAARTRSLSVGQPADAMLELHDCQIGLAPLHAFRMISAAPVAPNVQWVLILTPDDTKRRSLLFGLFIQNNELVNAGWIQDGDAPTPAEVQWWHGRLAALAQFFGDMTHVAQPDWSDNSAPGLDGGHRRMRFH